MYVYVCAFVCKCEQYFRFNLLRSTTRITQLCETPRAKQNDTKQQSKTTQRRRRHRLDRERAKFWINTRPIGCSVGKSFDASILALFFFEGCKRARCARRIFEISTWFYYFFFFVSLFRLRRALAPAPFKKSPPESIHRNPLFIFSFFVCLLCLSRSKQVGSFYSKGFQTLTSWPLFSSYVCFIKVDITREVCFLTIFFLLSNINLWDIVCLL